MLTSTVWHCIMMYSLLVCLLSFTLVTTKPVSIDTRQDLQSPSDALNSQMDDTNNPLSNESGDLATASEATTNPLGLAGSSYKTFNLAEAASDSLLASYSSNKVSNNPAVTNALDEASDSPKNAVSPHEAPSLLSVESVSQLSEVMPPELQADAGSCSPGGFNKKRQLSRFPNSLASATSCPNTSSTQNQPGNSNQQQKTDENDPSSDPIPNPQNNVVDIRRKRKKPNCRTKITACCQNNPVQAITVNDHTYFNYAVCVNCKYPMISPAWMVIVDKSDEPTGSLAHALCEDPSHEKCCQPHINVSIRSQYSWWRF